MVQGNSRSKAARPTGMSRPAQTAEPAADDVYAMYACRRCSYVVTPFDTSLPCPNCGNLTYRRISADDPLIEQQRGC